MQLEVIAVNTSEKKGTIKRPQPTIQLTANGVEGDAHSGPWHRQVSLLAIESIDKFSKEANRTIRHGEFAENITTKGIELYHLKPLDRLVGTNVELEVTQIGKKCHGDNCNIFQEVGNCVMPKEGIFARVIKGGTLTAGDTFAHQPKTFNIKVITLSDRAFHGLYQDKSGPLLGRFINEFFEANNYPVNIDYQLMPDEASSLKKELEQAIHENFDAVFTTGGTGVGPKDITPDVVLTVIEKEIPGIMDMIRMKYGQNMPGALLSRSVAGVAGKTQLYTLPGSPKAIKEYMDEINKTFLHIVRMLESIDAH